ncbi:hypothetical protein SLEP1_g22663 [Rubroshorea leprosula]|uniref:Secreted protein n=1 Tax=Rubroshorea leprosula TaxID=152421 RepID=A0AAV5JG03_9ROSI|nr:hypothetical protein SLEP1_g22663 [Rubroshorea leprosula]
MPWKTGEKAWFLAFFSCSRTQIEPRNSPPCWKIRICLALSAGCSCCGGKLLGFWNFDRFPVSFLLPCRRPFPNLQLRF